jgi:HEAT repeat protein
MATGTGEEWSVIRLIRPPALTMEGYLASKKKTLKKKHLAQSYAVLDGTKLYLYPDQKARRDAPSEALEVTGVTEWDGKGEVSADHPFAITTARHIYYQTAPTAAAATQWKDAINGGITQQRDYVDSLKTDKNAEQVRVLCNTASKRDQEQLASAFVACAKSGAAAQQSMIDMHAEKIILKLLDAENLSAKRQAAYLLRSMAGWSPQSRTSIVQLGGIPSIIKNITSKDVILVQQCVAVIANLARGNQQDIGNSGGIEALVPHLQSSSALTQRYTVTALRNLASEAVNLPRIKAAGALKSLVQMLSSKEMSTVEQVVALLRNMTVDVMNQVVIGQQLLGLGPLIVLCSCPDENVMRQAAGTLANLACNNENREMIGSLGGIDPLVHMLGEEHSGSLQLPAVLALKNLTHEHADNCEAVVASPVDGAVKLVGLIRRGLQSTSSQAEVMRVHTLYISTHTPCTIHHAPCTMHHAPCTMHHTPYTIHHAPYNYALCTAHHTPYTMHHAPYKYALCTAHHTPYTHTPYSYTIHHTHTPYSYTVLIHHTHTLYSYTILIHCTHTPLTHQLLHTTVTLL